MDPTKKSSSPSTKITLKLLIDKSKRKVLFAEAGKDFVDFLFGLLQLPVGAILRLLAQRGTATSWSIAKVYESVQSMDSNYMQPNQSKFSLLGPKCRPSNTKQTPMLEQFGHTDTEHQPNMPPSNPRPSLIKIGSEAGGCAMNVKEPAVVDGYVKEMVTYMVVDDLTVKPMSAISAITILNTFKVTDVACLEEKITKIDLETALKLVKASFESTTVLTDVFLRAENVSTVWI